MPDAFTKLDNRAVFDRFHAAIASGIVVLFIDIGRLVVISFHLLEGEENVEAGCWSICREKEI